MLVHPDKNMGNEKAVEAFKKLQNAYEVSFIYFAHTENLERKPFPDLYGYCDFLDSNGFLEEKSL